MKLVQKDDILKSLPKERYLVGSLCKVVGWQWALKRTSLYHERDIEIFYERYMMFKQVLEVIGNKSKQENCSV